MAQGQRSDMVDRIAQDYEPILRGSSQPIVLFIDEEKQVSNENFSDILGYESMEEWSRQGSILDNLDEEGREALLDAHRRAVAEKVASIVYLSWKKKSGEVIGSRVIVAPLPYHGSIHSIWFVDVNDTTGVFQV